MNEENSQPDLKAPTPVPAAPTKAMDKEPTSQMNPDIPELAKLGRQYFPEISTDGFWNILGVLCEEEICGENEDSWACAEETLGLSLPGDFRSIYQKPLMLWKVFQWCERACVHVGVLRHAQSGLCRPVIFSNFDGAWFLVGDSLKPFSRRAGALACLHVFQEHCAMFGVPGAEFFNYQPKCLSKEEVKAVYLQGGYSEQAFQDTYSEA